MIRNLMLVLLALVLTSPVQSQPQNDPISTVAATLLAKGQARVVLEGTLVHRVDDEKFELRDDSGTIVVEIEDKVQRDRSILLNRRVRVTGELERKLFGRGIHIDVSALVILN